MREKNKEKMFDKSTIVQTQEDEEMDWMAAGEIRNKKHSYFILFYFKHFILKIKMFLSPSSEV